jgi:hypothetical protein
MTTDNEELPVEEIHADEDDNVVFLRAEGKTSEESENLEIQLDEESENLEIETDEESENLEIETDEEVDYVIANKSDALIAPYISRMVERGRTCAQYMYNVSSIYLFWIVLHYFSAHLYVYYCVPSGVYGFLISPFLVAAPHCRAIRWIIQSGGAMMDNMWLVFGTWACSRIIAKSE